MKAFRQSGRSCKEAGSALLIAIFALLLISVVGIALLVSTGTDSALAGNYRTATGGYYAGVAGLEEARGRLLWKNPDYINIANSYPNLMDATGLPTWSLTQVLYIINPNTAAGEIVDPTGGNPANYADTEYAQEPLPPQPPAFPWGLGGAVVQQIPSVSPAPSIPLPGPNYKWVRINAITEASLNIDVNGDGVLDSAAVLFYDPAHIDPSTGKPAPSLVVSTPSSPPVPPTPTSVQALEITALAALPNGSRRILQYVVAPVVISPDATDQNFPAALTLDGNGVTFQSPGTPSYQINGVDGCNPPPPPGIPGSVPAIGYANPADHDSIFLPIQNDPDKSEYPGAPLPPSPPPPGYTPTTPSLSNTILRQSWLTPASLDAVMQDVVKSADVVINKPTATGTDISNNAPGMSISNPMTIVVNGDLNFNGWHNSGYGLLLVTGTLYYDPDASWDGVVLVVGKGIFSSSKNGPGGISGAVFVATTRDNSGNLLPGNALGAAFFGSQTGGYGSNPGFGIRYNSCSINRAKGPLSYKVLSFHEVLSPN